MTQTQALAPLTGADSLYRTYPMAIPLGYTFVYLASGWENEYLARVLAALLRSAAYPDVSTGAAAGRRARGMAQRTAARRDARLCDVGIQRLYRPADGLLLRAGGAVRPALVGDGQPRGRDAGGRECGLGGVDEERRADWRAAVGGRLLWVFVRHRVSLRGAAISLLACTTVAAPWYIRNLIGAGFLLPDTAWVDQAQRTLGSLLVFITLPQDYGVSGWAILAGLVWGLWQTRRPSSATSKITLLVWFVPFFAAWWLLASYDPRFLLSSLPLACALSGAALAAAGRACRVPHNARWRGERSCSPSSDADDCLFGDTKKNYCATRL